MSHSNLNKSVVTAQRGHFMNSVFFNPGIVASLVIVLIVSGIIFFNYISIRYNMLLLHRILIQYCMILHYQISRQIC